MGSKETNVLHPAGIELSIMRHGYPPNSLTWRDGHRILPPTSFFRHCQYFCHHFFLQGAIVTTHLGVDPLGGEQKRVEAVHLRSKILSCLVLFTCLVSYNAIVGQGYCVKQRHFPQVLVKKKHHISSCHLGQFYNFSRKNPGICYCHVRR